VLLLVGNEGATADGSVLARVVAKAASLQPGVGPGQVGPLVDAASHAKVVGFVTSAVERDGATALVDGRRWAAAAATAGGGGGGGGAPAGCTAGGCWVGPTVLWHQSAQDAACREEIFGPVLSVVRVGSWQEALAVENGNLFGNAACIYTTVRKEKTHKPSSNASTHAPASTLQRVVESPRIAHPARSHVALPASPLSPCLAYRVSSSRLCVFFEGGRARELVRAPVQGRHDWG
jgi:hypothetical protein